MGINNRDAKPSAPIASGTLPCCSFQNNQRFLLKLKTKQNKKYKYLKPFKQKETIAYQSVQSAESLNPTISSRCLPLLADSGKT